MKKYFALALLTLFASSAPYAAECKQGEQKFYVAFHADHGNGGFGVGGVFVCGTADLGNTEAGLELLSKRLDPKATKAGRKVIVLNVIPLAK